MEKCAQKKKELKRRKKDLTGPALLEMEVYAVSQDLTRT